MNNEFGYLDVIPFKEVDEKEQKLAIVNQKEDMDLCQVFRHKFL